MKLIIFGTINEVMKNFKINNNFFAIASSVILLISCTDQGCGGVLNITDEIVNKSNYNLNITIWGNFHLRTLKGKDELNLNKNSITSRTFQLEDLVFTDADSVLIIFEKKKKLFLKSESIHARKTSISNDDCTEYSTYTFTENDYANAEDCEGSCE